MDVRRILSGKFLTDWLTRFLVGDADGLADWLRRMFGQHPRRGSGTYGHIEEVELSPG